jgi:predicted CXXCH cytochrome family protein
MKRKEPIVLILIAAISLLCTLAARGASVVGSKHDLSGNSSDQPCVYCHTPHFASSTISAPLWNRNIGPVTFQMYSSPTINTDIPAAPVGVSLACLSCHDGVNSENDKHSLRNWPGSGLQNTTSGVNCERCHGRMHEPHVHWKLGTDLRNDHPISMVYPTAAQDTGFVIPPNLQKGWPDVPLYGGKVECPTCHNVHDPSKASFLRISNSGSALCFKCHNK